MAASTFLFLFPNTPKPQPPPGQQNPAVTQHHGCSPMQTTPHPANGSTATSLAFYSCYLPLKLDTCKDYTHIDIDVYMSCTYRAQAEI